MRYAMIVLIIFLGSVGFLSANVGGFNYGSVATGNFRPVGTNQIEIQSEDLGIDLYQDHAMVKVSYVMKNSAKDIEVKAGFPNVINKTIDWGWYHDKKAGYEEVSDYCIVSDGVTLAYQESKSEKVDWLKLPRGSYLDYGDDNENVLDDINKVEPRPLRVKWLVSSLKFKSGEKHKVEITYMSQYLIEGSGGEYDYGYDSRYFRYLLSTGNVWKGTIKKGKVVIRAVSVDANRLLIKPAGIFTRKGDNFIWEFKDLKPVISDNIEVCLRDALSIVVTSPEKNPMKYSIYNDPKRYYHTFTDCKVFSSSDRSSSYSANNLVDSNGDSVWVAGGTGGGIGGSVTFIFKNPKKVAEMGFASGFVKTESLYKANNRPCTIQLNIDNQAPVIRVLRDEYISCCDNDDRGYQWFALNSNMKPVHKIVMKIFSVYKGAKYNDTCISEVLFREKLTKDPFSQQAAPP